MALCSYPKAKKGLEKIKCWESYGISKIVVIILNKIVIESDGRMKYDQIP